ncbi:hypothetical protein [Photobacterium leiognathi]|uniref:hypothetical protein n=1 Tax=Photobacterium leiognathi TaxID=553611 RepID=UPI00298163CA|nr:hypothetical protein [Photobacterium leiognathi]
MDIERLSELLSDRTKKKQAVMDKHHSEISSFIENEMISLREFYKRTSTQITYGYFERLYYRSKKKLGNKKTTKADMSKEKTGITKSKKANSGDNNKITMYDISERLLNEISSYGFDEDDIKSWFPINELITNIKLRRKFETIKNNINGRFATKTIDDFKCKD